MQAMMKPSDLDYVHANYVLREQVERRVIKIAATYCEGARAYTEMGITGLVAYTLKYRQGSREHTLAKARCIAYLRKRGKSDKRVAAFKRAILSTYNIYWSRACVDVLTASAC